MASTTNCVWFSTFSVASPIPRRLAANNHHLGFSSSSSLCSTSRIAISPRKQFRRNNRLTCNALFGLGVPELVVIAGVAAIVFGPKKLPEVGRSIGKTVKSFQQVPFLLTIPLFFVRIQFN